MPADPTAPAITGDAQTKDTINTVNLKNLGDMNPLVAGLSSQNAVANQQVVQGMVGASLQAHLSNMAALNARTSRFILDTSAEEAATFFKQMGSNITDQITALASGQQAAKVANTTPPETGIAQQLANMSASLAAVLAFLQAQANGPAPVPAK